MKKLGFALCVMMVLALNAPTASAADINLFEWAINIDGAIGSPAFGPFGTVTVVLSGSGAHKVLGFFDYEIDEADNTFFNEYGVASGSAASGQSWEIDEPGYVFGDIYDNFLAGTLDNTNSVPAGSPDDVSMAMGWAFTLDNDDVATIRFYLSDTRPQGSPFYLEHVDPDSQASVYLWSERSIKDGGGGVIPEPGTIVLVLSGLGLAAALRLRKSA